MSDAGFGSEDAPYVENPFAGRIVEVHWDDSTPPVPPEDWSATWFVVGVFGLGFIPPQPDPLSLHELQRSSYTGPPETTPQGDSNGVSLPAQPPGLPTFYSWSASYSQLIRNSIRAHSDLNVTVNLVQVIVTGGVESIAETLATANVSVPPGGAQTLSFDTGDEIVPAVPAGQRFVLGIILTGTNSGGTLTTSVFPT